jgi:hypothetical protein
MLAALSFGSGEFLLDLPPRETRDASTQTEGGEPEAEGEKQIFLRRHIRGKKPRLGKEGCHVGTAYDYTDKKTRERTDEWTVNETRKRQKKEETRKLAEQNFAGG